MDQNVRPDDMERITTPELAQAFIDEQVAAIREQVGDKKVLLALSGGVDSSVVAALLIKAIGKNLVCVHVNHGLMRKGESEQVIDVFQNQMDANLVYVDATDRFLDLLAGVDEPETKRKIIGGEFIRVFEEEARKVGDEVDFLAQGTIWPDILESQDGVKAHHNVGGLPDDLQFELVEPVKLLFKDEVRVVGRELGLPESMVEGRCHRARGDGGGECGRLAVLRRGTRRACHRRARRRARLRVAGHHPRHQHRGRDDRRGAGAGLGAAEAHDRPHHPRGPRHLPRGLRPDSQTRRHGGVGVGAQARSSERNTKCSWAAAEEHFCIAPVSVPSWARTQGGLIGKLPREAGEFTDECAIENA